eukprot:TRINITY_DN54246_c0_g1_i1.p2 TRINITY_DN54246_c0_g1~~TRINITY_DN54246_c0_g1_i1.p2  ORF type:complete len:154 (+),score=15.13 TRINITY_DN54246_c0_g1_i1:346-807(+)
MFVIEVHLSLYTTLPALSSLCMLPLSSPRVANSSQMVAACTPLSSSVQSMSSSTVQNVLFISVLVIPNSNRNGLLYHSLTTFQCTNISVLLLGNYVHSFVGYSSCFKAANMSFNDKQALAWLRDKADQLVIADTDKGRVLRPRLDRHTDDSPT